MSRWYYRIGGTASAVAGAYVLYEAAGDHLIVGAFLLLTGLAAAAFSFYRRGDSVADAAKAEMEVGPFD